MGHPAKRAGSTAQNLGIIKQSLTLLWCSEDALAVHHKFIKSKTRFMQKHAELCAFYLEFATPLDASKEFDLKYFY